MQPFRHNKIAKRPFYLTLTRKQQYASSPDCSLYISNATYKDNISNNQELLLVRDHFLYSHYINVGDIFWEKLHP